MQQVFICDDMHTPFGWGSINPQVQVLARGAGRRALATLCIGVGQGIAIFLEAV